MFELLEHLPYDGFFIQCPDLSKSVFTCGILSNGMQEWIYPNSGI